VGNLPQVLYGLARTEPNPHSENTDTTPEPSLSAISSIQTPMEEKNRSLQAKVNELSSEIQSLLEKCSKQANLIEHYEKRWEHLKEEARKRRSSQEPIPSSVLSSLSISASGLESYSSSLTTTMTTIKDLPKEEAPTKKMETTADTDSKH